MIKIKKYPIPLFFLFFAIFYFWLVSPSLHAGFVADDISVLRFYKSILNPFSGIFFRPFEASFFWLIDQVFNRQLFWPHIILILINYLNAVLVLVCILYFTKNKWLSFVIALSFLFFYRHPFSVFIFSQTDSFLTTFYLASFLTFAFYLESKRKIYYLISLVLFPLALLIKEVALTLPFVLLIFEGLFYGWGNFWSKRIKKYLPFAIVTLAFIFLIYLGGLTSGSFYFNKLDYQLVSWQLFFKNFANFFLALLPIKFDQIWLSTNLTINILISIAILVSIIAILFNKKIDKLIRFLLIFILVNLFPYIFFAQLGYRERYLYLVSFSFIFLVFVLIEKLISKLKPKGSFFLLMMLFFIVWVSISFYLGQKRMNDWLLADQKNKNIQSDLIAIRPRLSDRSKHIYSLNFPLEVNPQVPLYIRNPYDIFYQLYGSLSSYQDIQDREIGEKLEETAATQPTEGVYVFYYQDGHILDYSDRYPAIKKLLLEQFRSEDIRKNFHDPYLWDHFEKNQGNRISYRIDSNQLKLKYKISDNGWVKLLNNDMAILPESEGFSIQVDGDGRGEDFTVELWDIQANESLAFKKEIDFTGWQEIKVPYSEMEKIGPVNIRYVNRLKITIESEKAISGKLILKNFQEF